MKYSLLSIIFTFLSSPPIQGQPCSSVLLDYSYSQDVDGRFVLKGRVEVEVDKVTRTTLELSTDVRMSDCRTNVLSSEMTSANTCTMDYISTKNKEGKLMVIEPFLIYLERAKETYQAGVTSVKLNKVEQCNYRGGRNMLIVLDDLDDISLPPLVRDDRALDLTKSNIEQQIDVEEDAESTDLVIILIGCGCVVIILCTGLSLFFICGRNKKRKHQMVSVSNTYKDYSFEDSLYDNVDENLN